MKNWLSYVFLILALTSHLLAQVERATIIGTITDKSGSVIPAADVTVTHESTNTSVVLRSDDAGEYTAVNLVPGSYTIEAYKGGFSRRVYRNFVVQVAQVARLDIALDVGSVEQRVVVRAETPLLQTETSSVGQVISPEPIGALPLNGRNFAQLAILAPGVTGLSYAQPGTINAGLRPDELRPGGTTMEANGARDSSNQVLMDSIDNTEMISQTFIVRPTVEGMQEFKVLTNNAGAEFGRAGGAVVVTSTKSGSNQLHGSAFEFLRNSALDAKNFFDRPDLPIPPFRLNQFGGSAGGPIIRNRTFFFADYEGARERLGQTIVVTVPSLAMRQGDFRGVAPNGIFDPRTTRPNPSGTGFIRDRFPNDIILSPKFDPIAFKLVNLYPPPQTSALVNNYVANPQKRSDTDRFDVRIDHQISSKDNFFGRYSLDDSRLTIPDTFNTDIGGNENSFAGPDTIRGHNGVVANTHIFSPKLVGEVRFGFTKFKNFLLPTQLTNSVWGQIPGRNTTDPFQPSAPIISPTGFAGLGNSRSDPLIRREHMAEEIGNVTWQKSSHSLRFGYDFRQRLISETASPPGESAFGRFNFDNGFTNNPAAPGGTGSAIASMLLGFPSRTTRDFFVAQVSHLRTNEYNMYARDQWRVSKRLTLNLGVHYEINSPLADDHNVLANFDLARARLLVAAVNASNTVNVGTDYKAIGPRVSFAYQLNDKTVARGGYGIFYDPQENFGPNGRPFRQVPFDLIFSTIPGSLFPDNQVSQGFKGLGDFPPPDINQPFGNLFGTALDSRNASVQQFNFGLQREVTNSSVLTVIYAGSLGHHLNMVTPANEPPPGAGNIQTRRPFFNLYPLVNNINYLETGGNSRYHSFQVIFERRFARGVFFNANWTYSHAIDDVAFDGGANGPIPQDPRNRRGDYGNSNNDIRHRLNLFGGYQLPFGPGKRFLNGESWTRWLVAGWEVNEIAVLQSGLPFTVDTTGSPANTGRGARADVVPGVNPYPAQRTPNQWFNPAAFAIPSSFNFGNSGRNILFGPRAINFDLTAAKSFPLGEGRQLIFRSEFFNAFNHPQFTLPATTIGAAGVGTISATARPSRQIQFVLKFVF